MDPRVKTTSRAEAHQVTKPLEGRLPFSDPGEPVTLFKGPMSVQGIDGRRHIWMDMARDGDIRWTLDPIGLHALDLGSASIQIEHPDLGLRQFQGHVTSTVGRGSITSAEIGDPTSLNSALVHWLNLPPGLPADGLTHGGSAWAGRLTVHAARWSLTYDARPDIWTLWSSAHEPPATLITHVCRIQRHDGSTFTVDDLRRVVDGLHDALSFAIGGWLSPGSCAAFLTRSWHTGDGLRGAVIRRHDTAVGGTPTAQATLQHSSTATSLPRCWTETQTRFGTSPTTWSKATGTAQSSPDS